MVLIYAIFRFDAASDIKCDLLTKEVHRSEDKDGERNTDNIFYINSSETVSIRYVLYIGTISSSHNICIDFEKWTKILEKENVQLSELLNRILFTYYDTSTDEDCR